jgi:chromosome segregation ATPase
MAETRDKVKPWRWLALQEGRGTMIPKSELERELKTLEAEYRFWVVEAIRMGRGIDAMEEEINHHDSELGPDRAADLRRRLTRIRDKHLEIEEKIRGIRARLEELRTRLEELP